MAPTKFVTKVTLLCFVLFFSLNCSKDADLLSEYAISDNKDVLFADFVIDDVYNIPASGSITIDVLSNDLIKDRGNAMVTKISNPTLGVVEINDDNTLTYTLGTIPADPTPIAPPTNDVDSTPPSNTPQETEPPTTTDTTTEPESTAEPEPENQTDTFTYTTEVEDENGNTTSEEGTVTIIIEEEESTAEQDPTAEPEPTTEPEPVDEEPTIDIPENARFVATNGSSSNNGESPDFPWNIEHAFSVAQAGQTIYVKAGNYGNQNLHVANHGTSSNPIRFIGYREVPDDIISQTGSTVSFDDYKSNGHSLHTSNMPSISGSNDGIGVNGAGIAVEKNYIEIHNFQISRKKYGIWMQADHCILRNVIAADCDSEAGGKGFGIYTFESNYTEINNSIVLNAGLAGIIVQNGDYQNHNDNAVFSDKESNPTDYYCFLTGSSERNVIRNIHVERVGALQHTGHGLGGNQKASYNEFYDSKVVNTSIELSFSGTNNNLFKRFHIDGNADEYRYHYSIQIANGSHSNRFEDFKITGGNGIQFLDWGVGDDTTEFAQYNEVDAGHHNIFERGTIENSTYGIMFHSYEQLSGVAHDNTFNNIVFKNMEAVFRVDRPNNGNKMNNCTIENTRRLQDIHYGNVLNFDFGNTIFINNEFADPN